MSKATKVSAYVPTRATESSEPRKNPFIHKARILTGFALVGATLAGAFVGKEPYAELVQALSALFVLAAARVFHLDS